VIRLAGQLFLWASQIDYNRLCIDAPIQISLMINNEYRDVICALFSAGAA